MQKHSEFWKQLQIQSQKLIIETKPCDPKAYKDLAIAYTRANQLADAISTLEKALELDQNYADAHYQLGTVYEKMGKKMQSTRAFSTYNKLVAAQKQQSRTETNS